MNHNLVEKKVELCRAHGEPMWGSLGGVQSCLVCYSEMVPGLKIPVRDHRIGIEAIILLTPLQLLKLMKKTKKETLPQEGVE